MALLAVSVWSQGLHLTTKPADLSAEQILERSIQAVRGREAYARLTSTVARGTLEFIGQHLHGAIEYYAKAPNKRLVITDLEHLGRIRQGFDGKVAWVEDPVQGLRRLEGAEAARVRREADFHSPVKWRELYKSVELKGRDTVGDRAVYVLRLRPRDGKPVTHYYDAETFLLLRQDLVQETPQGDVEVQAWLSDYRDVGGVKTPHRIEQRSPMGRIIIQFERIENNVEIEDARFAMPASRAGP